MKTITITRTDEDAVILTLAEAKGYKISNTVDITKEMLTIEAREKKFQIQKILEDVSKCIAITGTEEVANPTSPEQFIGNYYQTMINNDMAREYKIINKKALEETRRLEDQAIDKIVDETIEGGTKVEIV